MRNWLNFVLFQLGWFAAVVGAARGEPGWGPAAIAAVAGVHLALVPRGERGRELLYLVLVGALGGLVDTGLHAADLLRYPGSAADGSGAWVPPFIPALWVAFATLPRFSLRWLGRDLRLAALLGALGGPLSFYGGVRLGAVGFGESPGWSLTALAVEYATLTPLMLALAPGSRSFAT